MAEEPPASDEVELSVFGPGVGEAAAIHVGDGSWILVDSCVDSDTRRSASIDYLEGLGINVAENVHWIVATHAHNDHVRGLSQLVEACKSARLVVPEASTSAEFLMVLGIDEGKLPYGAKWSSYSEFRESYALIKARDKDARMLSWCSASKEFPAGAAKAKASMKMYFVAPSDVAITKSREEFAKRLLMDRTQETTTYPREDPNTMSSVFVLEAQGVKLLLGGDVELGNSEWGWTNIAANYSFSDEIDGHKVPHHGSSNAYEASIWNEWLKKSAINVVTPFRSSRLPRKVDVDRMISHGRELWQTSKSDRIAAPTIAKKTQAVLGGLMVSKVEIVGGNMGQVQVRWREGKRTVRKFGPAFQAK